VAILLAAGADPAVVAGPPDTLRPRAVGPGPLRGSSPRRRHHGPCSPATGSSAAVADQGGPGRPRRGRASGPSSAEAAGGACRPARLRGSGELPRGSTIRNSRSRKTWRSWARCWQRSARCFGTPETPWADNHDITAALSGRIPPSGSSCLRTTPRLARTDNCATASARRFTSTPSPAPGWWSAPRRPGNPPPLHPGRRHDGSLQPREGQALPLALARGGGVRIAGLEPTEAAPEGLRARGKA
jgi:hypothetical protein